MALPPELRCKIYEFTFCNMCIMPNISQDVIYGREIILKHLPGIIFASRRMKAEAWPVLLAQATLLYDHPSTYTEKPSRFNQLLPSECFHLVRYLLAPRDDSALEKPIPLSEFPDLRSLTFSNVNIFPPWNKAIELSDTVVAHAALIKWARNEYKVLKHARRCPWIDNMMEDTTRSFRIWIRLWYRIDRVDSCGAGKKLREGCAACHRMIMSTVDPELGVVVNDGFDHQKPIEDLSSIAECEGNDSSWRFYCHPRSSELSDAELNVAEKENRGVQYAVLCNPM
jgi:hypothetical protein